MSNKLCCHRCFSDQYLLNEILPSLAGKHKGTCDFCKSENISLLEPEHLREYFELVTGAYKPDANGKFLINWLQEDWLLFTDTIDTKCANKLLKMILGDAETTNDFFSPRLGSTSNYLNMWQNFNKEIMHENRWFISNSIDTNRLKELLGFLITKDIPRKWFRARICDDKAHPIEEMHAPMKEESVNGRANPAGIPYLYLSSKHETAIAEIRPHTGQIVCVANFTIPEITAIDLQNPRKIVSPFMLGSAEAVAQLRNDLPFLEILGKELIKPVLPKRAAIDYIPSQYLCELIKYSGYDGVVYSSSVSDGINFALFHPAKAKGNTVNRYRVTKVEVKSESYTITN